MNTLSKPIIKSSFLFSFFKFVFLNIENFKTTFLKNLIWLINLKQFQLIKNFDSMGHKHKKNNYYIFRDEEFFPRYKERASGDREYDSDDPDCLIHKCQNLVYEGIDEYENLCLRETPS